MTVEETERCVGCLVQVKTTVYNIGGSVYLLYGAWREVSMSGSKDYGVTLRDTAARSFVETKASLIDLIPYRYPKLKYMPEHGCSLNAAEVMCLLGSVVSVGGSPVWLKRIYKTADDYRHMRYEADIQEISAPYTVSKVQISDISLYTGAPPTLPVIQNKMMPLRQRQLAQEAAAAAEQDIIKRSQTAVLTHLAGLADSR